jgi:hypothetical protein
VLIEMRANFSIILKEHVGRSMETDGIDRFMGVPNFRRGSEEEIVVDFGEIRARH